MSAGPGRQPASSKNTLSAVAAWQAEAFRVVGLAIAPNTRRGYERSVQLFEEFRKEHGYGIVWPPPVEQLIHYCVSLKN